MEQNLSLYYVVQTNLWILILIMVWYAVGSMDKQKSVLVSPGIIWITTIETDSLLICTEMCFR